MQRFVKNGLIAMLLILLVSCGKGPSMEKQPQRTSFFPGQEWPDNQGNHIQAHGGGFLFDNGVYYWYGEDKNGPTLWPRLRVDIIGINCYSSRDLYNWKFEGNVFPAVKEDTLHDMHPSRVAERPKVLFNEKSGKYVMWLHNDNEIYQDSRVVVAVADKPTGPFEFVRSFLPLGKKCTDMTLFKDEDGKAYFIAGADWHSKVIIVELTDDFLDVTDRFSSIMEYGGPPHGRESPAMFKRQGKYYLVTSGTTGWAPNAARYDVAEHIFGPYTNMGNPCVGPWAEATFFGQNTYVIPVNGRDDSFIFVADRWNMTDLRLSRYLFLPIEFGDGDSLSVQWHDEWSY